ncbi:hypothetical protein OAO87_02390 [bacterium]|nr:hypothetical protein [bacterium]
MIPYLIQSGRRAARGVRSRVRASDWRRRGARSRSSGDEPKNSSEMTPSMLPAPRQPAPPAAYGLAATNALAPPQKKKRRGGHPSLLSFEALLLLLSLP